MQKKKWFQLFLKGLISIYFFYVTRKFVSLVPMFIPLFYIYFSIVRLDVDINLPFCIISMNTGI